MCLWAMSPRQPGNEGRSEDRKGGGIIIAAYIPVVVTWPQNIHVHVYKAFVLY